MDYYDLLLQDDTSGCVDVFCGEFCGLRFIFRHFFNHSDFFQFCQVKRHIICYISLRESFPILYHTPPQFSIEMRLQISKRNLQPQSSYIVMSTSSVSSISSSSENAAFSTSCCIGTSTLRSSSTPSPVLAEIGTMALKAYASL